VQALCKHRAEMQAPEVVTSAADQTLEQQLGTQREALCVLRVACKSPEARHPKAPPEAVELCCGGEGNRPKVCMLFKAALTPCCTSSGDLGDVPLVELRVADSPTNVPTPLSARSSLSTTSSTRIAWGSAGLSEVAARRSTWREAQGGL